MLADTVAVTVDTVALRTQFVIDLLACFTLGIRANILGMRHTEG